MAKIIKIVGFSLFEVILLGFMLINTNMWEWPEYCILALFFCIVSMVIATFSIFFPINHTTSMTQPYRIALAAVSVIYATVVTLLSWFTFRSLKLLRFSLYQLMFTAVFLVICGIIISFAKRSSTEQITDQAEKNSQMLLLSRLLDLESRLTALGPEFGQAVQSFSQLKDRINASTPMSRGGRVTPLDQQIYQQIETAGMILQNGYTEQNAATLSSLFVQTLQLVQQREQLLIQ